jgi:hypothetical protein
MSVDNEQILQAVLDLTKEVSEHNAQFREFRGVTDTKVKSLEDDAKNSALWQKIQMVCVIPVVGALHQVAQHYHWIK